MTAYLRDPDTGNVYLETDNPIAAWTPEEWAALLAAKEAQVTALEEQIAGLMQPKTLPDEETLALWNSFCEQQGAGLPEQLASLQAELAEMQAV